ncbi:type II 3-dehydroquinate dehydratase [Fusobacterium sp.]|uniref:type II 3-dehydroquinate dehydratase n=1 Tax=Fusobacterium sp. TaxID=68766 RepID=UPI0029003877|nr:type II 3-dehydroquinate dehydratase [Fusobacterium sp.]MDU1910687.1 type II 3-dehydroquinate dehydratase [Fusobacterium sp.]
MKIMVLNGPNLNFLGIREKNIYGQENYQNVCEYIKDKFNGCNIEINIFQSNIEGEMINILQRAYSEKYDGIVINPGAYTHTSIALYDAIKSINIPTVEIHLSNIHQREEFRHKSYTAPACIGQICGFGKEGYIFAIEGLIAHLSK